jgi:hypothetical protein
MKLYARKLNLGALPFAALSLCVIAVCAALPFLLRSPATETIMRELSFAERAALYVKHFEKQKDDLDRKSVV